MLKFPVLKSVLKVCTIVAALVFGSSTMKADSITGGVSIAGFDTFTSSSITFTGTPTLLGSTLNVPFTAPITLSSIANFATANGIVLFSGTSGAYSTIFTLNGPVSVVTYIPGVFLSLSGNGTFSTTVPGFTATSGNFTLSSNTTGTTTFTINSMVAATPEPNSLMLLGTGLVSTAGMMIRRRRNTLA